MGAEQSTNRCAVLNLHGGLGVLTDGHGRLMEKTGAMNFP